MKPRIPYSALGRVVRSKRKDSDLSLSDLSDLVHVSAATLSRIERSDSGDALPTARPETIAKVADWAGVEVVYGQESNPAAPEPLPALVSAHLRADKNLKPNDAAALARMFEAAYRQMTTG